MACLPKQAGTNNQGRKNQLEKVGLENDFKKHLK